MRYWIFQGNPDYFDVDQYFTANEKITWLVLQKHLAKLMRKGDKVFFWRSAGRRRKVSGIIASGVLLAEPTTIAPDDVDSHLWHKPPPKNAELHVGVQVLDRCLAAKNIVRRDWLKIDPILKDLRILKLASETNYLIQPTQAARLDSLVRNTGRDFTRRESLAGLWAYSRTVDSTVSRADGSPVAEVALRLGRAITGIYNKVMNFRALDPRDNRKGLTAGSRIDEEVWKEFFDETTGQLRLAELDAEYESLWGDHRRGLPPKLTYSDFGDAPNDDLSELQRFAARVRRGQPAFRKNLANAYNELCAISGHGPLEVLEAVHIVPHAESGINELDNGLLIRADIHYLFDSGLLQINPETLVIELDKCLATTPYWGLNGKILSPRKDGSQPRPKYLRLRWRNRKLN